MFFHYLFKELFEISGVKNLFQSTTVFVKKEWFDKTINNGFDKTINNGSIKP